MRKITFVLISLVFGACATPGGGFNIRELVTTEHAGNATLRIFTRILGEGHWVPVADVTRTAVTEYWVEVEEARPGRELSLRRVDLMRQPGTDIGAPPHFIGATSEFAYWADRHRYFALRLSTMEVSTVQCPDRYLAYGHWTALNPTSIRRTTSDGTFDLSPGGAVEVQQAAK